MAASPRESIYGWLFLGQEMEELWPEWTRPFPDLTIPIPDLLNHENFYDWVWHVERNLDVLNLLGFIEGTERPPEVNRPIDQRNFDRFFERHYRAFCVIYDSVKPILSELKQKGFWAEDSSDPKILWDAIQRWNTDVPYSSKCEYLKEFSNINRDQFESLDAYLFRVGWLNMRLREVNLAIPEDVQMGFVIEGLRAHHMRWAMVLEERVKDGTLTLDTLIREIRGHQFKMKAMEEIPGNNTTDANCPCNDNNNNSSNNKNNKRRQNKKRPRNNQGHRPQHNGVTKRYSTNQ